MPATVGTELKRNSIGRRRNTRVDGNTINTMAKTPTQPSPDDLAMIEQLLAHFEQLESQFQSLREGLTHSHRLATLGTLASIVAHEYNNILTPIISYAELAMQKPDDAELTAKALQKTVAGCHRAAKISSSLLGFASHADDQRASDLRETVTETIGCMARDPKKDGIELTVDVPDVSVLIPPINLQQVLLNLLLNARKAMHDQRSGSIKIIGETVGPHLHLHVSDTGPGIPDEIRERLFEAFVTQAITDTAKRGTGLGLCICRDLIQSAGGTITVESEPGQGATFHIKLPLAEDICETT